MNYKEDLSKKFSEIYENFEEIETKDLKEILTKVHRFRVAIKLELDDRGEF